MRPGKATERRTVPDPQPAPSLLRPEELTTAVRARSEAATTSGALVSMPTRVHEIVDGGTRFVVRVTENVARKAAAAAADPGGDPFAPPWEPDLLVGAVSSSHVVLLNKFNVLPEHVLLVTRDYRPQTELPDAADLEAALIALAAGNGLVFYNGGPEAGASQPHKHLQRVPLPLGPGPEPLPFAPLLAAAEPMHGSVGHCPSLPFAHAITPVPAAWWQAPAPHAGAALSALQALWQALGHGGDGGQQPAPYNLLLTREWMWLVPRSRGEAAGIGVNALGYAGALLVRDHAQLERLQRTGPLRLLAATAAPANRQWRRPPAAQ
ncbi:MAG: DUF4922 domain-containing protein [Halofilum sp. (in: g-proteobacteria)]|nr:DUF4922 domain-containing protein [Halofilum sp. (in: g-proteobacteria)]